ncbi:DUF4402 domain-containing protein [Massilia niabensis]|uniref:DUF4402 domain-containing protein n=1 Tax=Massilia niabensis TaxID=544910 RepID=A0ABW0L763_9BURK
MNKHACFTSNVFRLAVLALAIAGAGSAIAATTTASATSTIIAPINIAKAVDLAFGSFAASAAPGTVTLTPGGTRTVDGGVAVIAASPSSAAKFDVTGQPGFAYSISVTGTPLTSGGNSMAFTPVSDLTGSAATSGNATAGLLTAGGTQSIFVGGVLSVGASQAPGDYAGEITALVNYN